MLILRGEDGKRWVGVAPSHQTFAVLANKVKTSMCKQSHTTSSGDIEFSPSPDILSQFFFKGSPCWEDLPDMENENADVFRTAEASKRHRKQTCTREIGRVSVGLENACTVSIHLGIPG